MNRPEERQVNRQTAIVVGAGPVGMTAALALRHHGVAVTLLEAQAQARVRPGSRAIFVHKASLSTLESISPGLGRTLAENGLVWPRKRTLWRGREVYRRDYPAPRAGDMPPFTSLPQVEAERHLYAACVASGVQFVWEAAVKEVVVADRQVQLTTDMGQVWHADYVVAADGAKSAVRAAIGVNLEGTRSANTFLVVDVQEDAQKPLPVERVFHYQHPAAGGRNVLYVPFMGGWRVDLQLFESDNPEEFSSPDGARRWLRQVIDAKYAERVTWVSSYQFMQVVASQFVDDHHRVVLTGEAAHLFAPFGARGMNSGIADAVLAAAAVASALAGDSPQLATAAISSFASDRLAAARYNCDAAGTALRHLQGRSLQMRWKRQVAAAVAPVWRRAGRWLDEGPYGPKAGPSTVASKY